MQGNHEGHLSSAKNFNCFSWFSFRSTGHVNCMCLKSDPTIISKSIVSEYFRDSSFHSYCDRYILHWQRGLEQFLGHNLNFSCIWKAEGSISTLWFPNMLFLTNFCPFLDLDQYLPAFSNMLSSFSKFAHLLFSIFLRLCVPVRW